MGKKSPESSKFRIPPTSDGIQVNFCKNPACKNYGVPAAEKSVRGRGRERDQYAIAASGKGVPVIKCHACGEYPPLKSNTAIKEEVDRVSGYLAEPSEPCCPDTSCAASTLGVASHSDHYQSFGVTRSGSKRYRCKECGKTFSVGRSTLRQKQPHKNKIIFQLLVNKTPFRRICEVADISEGSLYPKIDFLYQQTQAFIGNRERKLAQGFPIRRLYVGVDRQDYVVNWSQRKDKRNVQLTAVGSADNETGYVFGMHLNFDPSLDAAQVEKHADEIGDCETSHPFRRYARLWLNCDYLEKVKNCHSGSLYASDGSINAQVRSRYDDATVRDDVEVFEQPTSTTKLPTNGAQTHAEYTLYGHFFLLKRLFGGVEKVRFFLDQDSGMRAACLGAFQPEIAERRCDAFYVRINKDLTVDEKKQALRRSREQFISVANAHPDLTQNEVKLMLIRERMLAMASIGKWKDQWLVHPFPNMSEPQKAVCYLTNFGDYDDDHLAWLYNKASLHGIDCFFMQVRRRLSLLERPIASASAARRMWHGYSAYNPESIVKMLAIFRVFYNYVLAGQDKKTPAMRLGLAKGAVTLEDIIYYS